MNFLAIKNVSAMHKMPSSLIRSIAAQAIVAQLRSAQRNYITQKVTYCLPFELVMCEQGLDKNQEFHKYLIVSNDPSTWVVEVSKSWLHFGTVKSTPILYAPAYCRHHEQNKVVDSYLQVTSVATDFQGLQVDDTSTQNSEQCLKALSELAKDNNGSLPLMHTIKVSRTILDELAALPAQFLSDEYIANMNNTAQKASWEQRAIIKLSLYNELCTRSSVY